MNRFFLIFLFQICFSTASFGQQFTTTNYRDTTLPYLELNPAYYDFDYPILSDILDSNHFSPPTDGTYLAAEFGHRYLSSRAFTSDNHGGFDYWADHTYQGVTYDVNHKVPIQSMCDGYISQVIEGHDSVVDLTSIGRSVRVTCDSSFQTLGFKIKINYRHLSKIGNLAAIADTAAFGTVRIAKGDTIGLIGKSGTTSNVHLHLSTQTIHPVHGSSLVNTARLFNPHKSPGVLTSLTKAKISLLQNWPDSALFRVIWPFNQTINQFEFINQSDTIIFNKEDAYRTGSATRDSYDCIPNVNVFAYQFNGKLSAKARYLSEMSNMLAEYPASPQRDTNLSLYGYAHYPITHDSVSFVYDFIVKGISPFHQKNDFIVKLSDVWGNTVEGQYPTTVGLKKRKVLKVNIFPNPTKDIFTLQFDKTGDRKMTLFDLSGKQVLQKSSSEVEFTLDLNAFSKGLYLLRIDSKNTTKYLKVMKE